MQTQWVRSCVRLQSSQASFLSTAAARGLTCAKELKGKKKKSRECPRPERSCRVWTAAPPADLLPNWTALHKPDSPSALEETHTVRGWRATECIRGVVQSGIVRTEVKDKNWIKKC